MGPRFINNMFPRCLFVHNTIMHCPLFINWKNGIIPAEKSLSCKYYILEEWHNIHINIAHTLHSAEIQSCYQNIYRESWWSKKSIPWCWIKLLLSSRDSDDACLHRLQAAKMGKIFHTMSKNVLVSANPLLSKKLLS